MNKKSRSSVEMNDPASRPALADTSADIAGHTVIFLGFPIWWYTAPTIIMTFLEAYDFSGKVIVPFATSGGSGVEQSVRDLKELYPHLNIVSGHRFTTGTSQDAVQEWLAVHE